MKLELGNAATYTHQTVFDFVCRHLAAQGRRAIEYGKCRYRMADGRSCAVGCLIPDEFYDAEIESRSACNLHNSQLPDELLPFRNSGLLTDFQEAHDYSDTLEKLLINLKKIAATNHLNPSAIEEIKSWNE